MGSSLKMAAPIVEQVIPKSGDVSSDIDLDKMMFYPWPGRILAKRFPADRITRGKIHLPDSGITEKHWGTIERLPLTGAPPGLAVGDIVVWLMGAGDDLSETLGEGYVCLDYRTEVENDIIGIFRPKEKTTSADSADCK